MRCLDLFQGLFANRTQVRVCLRKRQLNAHTAANKDRQIIHQSINASDASENPRSADGWRLLERTARLQSLTGKPDDIEEIADFVSENAEENVAVAFRPVRITSDYLSDRLIDGLVKPGYFRKNHVVVARSASYPQEQDTRPQSTVFGNRLLEIEARI